MSAAPATPVTAQTSQIKRSMMSILQMSPHAAEIIAFWATIISIVAALVTGLAAGVLFVAQNVQQRDADLRIAQAQITALQAKDDAAKATLEAEKIREKLAWRSLSNEQMVEIKEIFESVGSIEIVYQNGDPECQSFGNYFYKALDNGGRKMYKLAAFQAPSQDGIIIYSSDNSKSLGIVEKLRKVGIISYFSEEKIPLSGMGGGLDSDISLQIIIPSKEAPNL